MPSYKLLCKCCSTLMVEGVTERFEQVGQAFLVEQISRAGRLLDIAFNEARILVKSD